MVTLSLLARATGLLAIVAVQGRPPVTVVEQRGPRHPSSLTRPANGTSHEAQPRGLDVDASLAADVDRCVDERAAAAAKECARHLGTCSGEAAAALDSSPASHLTRAAAAHDETSHHHEHPRAHSQQLSRQKQPPQRHTRATAVLLKPGATLGSYFGLMLRRNAAIAACDWASKVDHLVFYEDRSADGLEGLTPASHLAYLQNRSAIALTFVSVSSLFARGACWNEAWLRRVPKKGSNRVCQRTDLSDAFKAGYKTMCWFWFSEFLTFTPDAYEQVLRIDDDCVLVGAPGWPSLGAGVAVASADDEGMDRDEVTSGMSAFFGALTRADEGPFPEEWASPYTNVILFDTKLLRGNQRLQEVFRQVHASGCVFVNRWGDLPLWGAARVLLGWRRDRLAGLSYWHGSHARLVPGGARNRRHPYQGDGWLQAHRDEASANGIEIVPPARQRTR